MELLQLIGAVALFMFAALVVVSAILGEYGWGISKISGGYEVRFGCGVMSFTKKDAGA